MPEDFEATEKQELHPKDQLAVDWAQMAIMGGRSGKEVVDDLKFWGAKERDLRGLVVGRVYEGVDDRIRIGLDHPTTPQLGRSLGKETLKAVHDLRVEEGDKVLIPYPKPGELGKVDPRKSYVFTFSRRQYEELRRKIEVEKGSR